ncbi:MAG: J domain-containing protein [Rhodospirillaceae bacterium]|nr:J domain-containing protein [Rhodospirillaceae bacterium]MBL6942403.1 J domain-containing protein [Rhodospirillales bacterium]
MTAKAAPNRKHSYTIPCSSDFRDAVMALADKRRVNVADLARSVVLVVSAEEISDFPDPGGPLAGDREIVVLKSGAAKGKPWQRKPRLQVRMAPGYDAVTLRRALGVALSIDKGAVDISLNGGIEQQAAPVVDESLMHEAREELTRLRSIISALSFEPLPQGIKNRNDALHILGFPPGSLPDGKSMKSRFRTLASIHHPDSGHGDHDRMSQLNEAMDHLKRGAA